MTDIHGERHAPLLSKNYQLFLLCCELRNFSQVGKATGLTQSAVSKAIINLEEQLGFELFVRKSRPLALTAEARFLEQYYRRVSGEYNQIMQQIRSTNFIKPVLRVGITENLSCHLGFEVINQTTKQLSQIVLTTASSNILNQWLSERKIDLAISTDSMSSNAPLFQMCLLQEPSVVFLPKSIGGLHRSWSWTQLQTCGLPMISYWKETGTGKLNSVFLHARGIFVAERIVVDSDRLMMKLVAQGVGWGFARVSAAVENRDLLEGIELVPCPAPDLMQEVSIFGREAEFVAEAQYLYGVCCKKIRDDILPVVDKIFPSACSKIVVGHTS